MGHIHECVKVLVIMMHIEAFIIHDHSFGTYLVVPYAWLGDRGILSTALSVITSSYTGPSQVRDGLVAIALFFLHKMPYASFLGRRNMDYTCIFTKRFAFKVNMQAGNQTLKVEGRAPEGGEAPERGNPPEGGVATLPTTLSAADCGDRGP